MSSDLQRELEASRPEWYGLVLACLRGEIPIDQVPQAWRWLCVDHRRPGRTGHAVAVRQAEDIIYGR